MPRQLSQEVRAAIAELRDKMPELVSGVGERQGFGSLRYSVAGQDLDALLGRQRSGVQT
jgi:hypothetical protein